jgi:hypothetical protein
LTIFNTWLPAKIKKILYIKVGWYLEETSFTQIYGLIHWTFWERVAHEEFIIEPPKGKRE